MKSAIFYLKRVAALLVILSVGSTQAYALSSWEIREEFFRRLEAEKSFGPYEITADVRYGNFEISGVVSSMRSRERATEIASSIAGVRQVQNWLKVDPLSGGTALDTSIDLQRVRTHIGSDASLGAFDLRAAIEDGALVLSGTVQRPEDALRIERRAKEVAGVHRVINRLQSVQPPSDQELARRVREALQANTEVDLHGLTIDSSSGIVTISGNRPDHRDRDRILSIALMVEGVQDVRGDFR